MGGHPAIHEPGIRFFDPVLRFCSSTYGLIGTQVLSNLVNYKSFGFTKIVPRAPESAFAAVVANSANAQEATVIWGKVFHFQTYFRTVSIDIPTR